MSTKTNRLTSVSARPRYCPRMAGGGPFFARVDAYPSIQSGGSIFREKFGYTTRRDDWMDFAGDRNNATDSETLTAISPYYLTDRDSILESRSTAKR